MNKKSITLLVTLILTLSFSLFANGSSNTDENKDNSIQFRNSELNNFLLAQNTGDDNEGEADSEKSNPRKLKKVKDSFRDGKSPLIASGLSLLIPGAGEIYGEDYLRAGIFLGIEVSLWSGFYYYNSDGNEKTDEFHEYASNNFLKDNYYGGIVQFMNPTLLEEAGITWWDLDYVSNAANWDSVSHYLEVDSLMYSSTGYKEFTHVLPSTKTQQYYEMIGKYHQFAMGWNDFNGYEDGTTALTLDAKERYGDYSSYKQEEIYENMRYEANLAYEAGQNFLMISVLNHVASAFDAAYVIKSKYRIETKIRVNKKERDKEIGLNNFKVSYIVNF